MPTSTPDASELHPDLRPIRDTREEPPDFRPISDRDTSGSPADLRPRRLRIAARSPTATPPDLRPIFDCDASGSQADIGASSTRKAWPCILVLKRTAFGSNASSSAISTPDENGHFHESTNGQENLQEFLKTNARKELGPSSLDKERKLTQSKGIVTEEFSNAVRLKGCKNLGMKKHCSSSSSLANNHTPKKHPRRGEHHVMVQPTEDFSDLKCVRTWICKNSACKALLNAEDTFCRRCSCCICHLFDDNKDPSLWLVCSSETDDQECCGLSCHIECAFQRQRVGVIDLGQSIQLDGSYCCASCGKVSGILGCWKKQLLIAKDARRVDVLCYRIFLSYRLLEGTSQFKELHEFVEDAKAKLETEVGPVHGVSAKMARGIVSRLSVAFEVQKLCSLAIEKVDEWLCSASQSDPKLKDSLPAACKFQFEEITSSSLVIVLKETSSASDSVKGYKLWYCNSRELPYSNDPAVFQRIQRRILISNLQPCTEYAFRIISFTDNGDLGHSEAKCFTKSVEIIQKNAEQNGAEGCSSSAKKGSKAPTIGSSGFKVRNLGKILRQAWAQEEGCCDWFCNDDVEEDSYGGSDAMRPDVAEEEQAEPAVSRRLDLNVASVPDLNADVTTPPESSPEEENICSSEKNGQARSNGSGDSQTCAARPVGEVPAVESRPESRKRGASAQDETYDGGSTLVSGSPLRSSKGYGQLDDNYEYCVKVIRWLECHGYIEKDFRMKFLTWFSLRSSEQERRVVITFIRTLIEEPSSLAGQLLDTFLEIVTCKMPRHGFCSKLWH
ncbi:hypothetical protein J5N97_027791 [Dioscorea zingiberensis]|uniref:Fibronectin type-III domain-containing protein n=1 Tax=Dioscorea zingiberensis TaxID=325984 RepID=A0A9D5BXV0_9LILI|nr:hypothetical protein J5N97_027791 [Dioscorea zingiberensis]